MIDRIRTLIYHFISLWSYPQANAPEIGLTIGLFVFAVSLSALIAVLTIRFFRRFTYIYQPDLAGNYKVELVKIDWFKLLLTAGLILMGALFFVAVTTTVTANSSVCGKACHSMNPDYQSWRRSSHAQVPCVACHPGVGLFGVLPLSHYVVALSKELRGSYAKPINNSGRYGAISVDNKLCLRCHSPANRSFTPTHGLNMTSKVHVKHLNAALRCTNCHNRVAHDGAEKYKPLKTWINKTYNSQESLVGKRNPKFTYANNLRMRQGCWRCHKSGGKFIEVSGKVKTGPYQAANGAVAPTKCSTCHNKQWDIKPPGHKERNMDGIIWKSGLNHGIEARKDFSSCQACHDKNTWCSTKCHKGITMPHIPKWKGVHMIWAKTNGRREDCRMCHEADPTLNFCGQRCHHDSFRKQFKLSDRVPWKIGKEQHGVVAKATNGRPCFRCHEQKTWCTTQCHKGITMPHKIPEWRKVHFKVAREVGKEVCARCHNKDGKINDFCLYCHHQKFGIPKGAGKYEVMSKAGRKILSTNDKEAAQCFTHHHQRSFCVNCHQR